MLKQYISNLHPTIYFDNNLNKSDVKELQLHASFAFFTHFA